MLKIAVLISGSGSNLQALIDACAKPDFPASIAVVISNKPNAYGVTRAQEAGIPVEIIKHTDYPERQSFDEAMSAVLEEHGIELVCLAGFMRLLSEQFVEKWHNRLINIHPSLLPSFKGLNGPGQAVEAGVRFAGCTVHYVRPEMDSGPIIIQAVAPVLPSDTEETLATRILEQEHQCYPRAVEWIATGALKINGDTLEQSALKTAPAIGTLNPQEA